MSRLSRRTFMIGGGSVPLLAACGNGLNSGGGARIDARADAALDFMVQEVPGTAELMRDAAGMLVMPLVTEAGFGFGGAYGRGALRMGGATVDYYSAASRVLRVADRGAAIRPHAVLHDRRGAEELPQLPRLVGRGRCALCRELHGRDAGRGHDRPARPRDRRHLRAGRPDRRAPPSKARATRASCRKVNLRQPLAIDGRPLDGAHPCIPR
jgi:hypothetical protein